jgi:hypothetical protein
MTLCPQANKGWRPNCGRLLQASADFLFEHDLFRTEGQRSKNLFPLFAKADLWFGIGLYAVAR